MTASLGNGVDQRSRSHPSLSALILGALFVVVAGLALGVGTQVLQGALPGNVGQLANSGAVWALGAAVIGAGMRSDRLAALGGATALVIASYSYYGAVEHFEHIASDGTSARLWAMIGLVVGPVFGILGRWIRFDATRRWPAVALAAGVMVGEGAHLIWFVGVDGLRAFGVAELVTGALAIGWSGLRSATPRTATPRAVAVSVGAAAAVVTVVCMRSIGGAGL